MRSPRFLAVLLLLSPCLTWAAEAPSSPAEVGERMRAVVREYEKLLRELDLNRLPSDLHGYAAVTEKLDQVGERLEQLSRVAARAEELTPDELQPLSADIGQLAGDLAALRGAAFPLRVWAHLDARGHRKPSWGLGIADALAVVPRARETCPAEVTTTVELAAARGEAASSQIVVVSLSRDLRGLAASCKGLRGPGASLPGSAVRFQPVGYLPVAGVSGGPQPEVLLPPGPVNVTHDEAQPLWLTITVPADQKPGQYEGEAYLKPHGHGALKVTLRLRVWNFGLPPKPSLRCAVALDADALARWYRSSDAPATLQRYADLLRAYRCLPCAEGQGSLLADDPQGWQELLPEAGNAALSLDPGEEPVALRTRLWGLADPSTAGLWYGLGNDWGANSPGAGLEPLTWQAAAADTPLPLVYPGPEGQPLPAVRLAVLRDGLEDADYLWLVRQRAGGESRVAEALQAVEALIRGTPTATRLLEARWKLGEALTLQPPGGAG